MTDMAIDERGTMSSFLQHRRRARHGPAMRPLFAGALTCGMLLATAPAAVANHMVMADGTMCPHAAGTPIPGEAAAVPGPVRTASTAPIAGPGATASAPGKSARPATKPGSNGPSKGAAQTQAQRPATTQAQTQRPAAASAPAQRPVAAVRPAARVVTAPTPAKAGGVTSTPSHRTSVAHASKAREAVTAKHAVSRPTATPVAGTRAATQPRASAVDRPAAGSDTAGTTDDGGSAAWFGLFGLLAVSLVGAIAVVAGLRARRAPVRAVPVLTPAEMKDAAMEAELQAMIVETKARALYAPDDLEEAGDDRRFTITG